MGCYRCGSEEGTETRLCPSCARKRIEERKRVRTASPAPTEDNPLNLILTILIGLMIGAAGLLIIAIRKANTGDSTVETEQVAQGWIEEEIPLGGMTVTGAIKVNNSFWVQIENQKDEVLDLDYYIVQYDAGMNVVKKELLKRTLAGRRKLTKSYNFEPGAVEAKLEEVEAFESRQKTGWADTVYKKELIGMEDSAQDGLVTSGSTGTNSCQIYIYNQYKPKHLEIYVKHLDAFNGNVIKTDTYEYDIGFNRKVSREFPFIPGEKFCSVDTSDHKEFMKKFEK